MGCGLPAMMSKAVWARDPANGCGVRTVGQHQEKNKTEVFHKGFFLLCCLKMQIYKPYEKPLKSFNIERWGCCVKLGLVDVVNSRIAR